MVKKLHLNLLNKSKLSAVICCDEGWLKVAFEFAKCEGQDRDTEFATIIYRIG
jgi:hypothetical protein